jgi:deoxycytidylate deaminase
MFRSLAKSLCLKSDHRQHHHAAIVTIGGAIKSVGFNKGEIHAEFQALDKIWPNERKGARVYSFRLRKDGTWSTAKPCPKCEQYLRDNGVKIVYYTNAVGVLVKMKL